MLHELPVQSLVYGFENTIYMIGGVGIADFNA